MTATIDGTASNTASGVSSIAVTLSTGKTNDIIIVAVHCERTSTSHATISSISDVAGLSWAKRSGATLDGGVFSLFHDAEIWWAKSTNALSGDVITITFGQSIDEASAIAFGVNGVDAAVWDANGSLPVTATSTTSPTLSVSGISTTSTLGMILAFGFLADFVPETAGTIGGQSAILIATVLNAGGQSTTCAEYLSVAAAQSAISASFGKTTGRDTWLMIADALVGTRAPQVFNDSFAASVAAADSISNAMTTANTLSDSIASGDSVSPGNVYVSMISDSVTATDGMTGSSIWNDVSTPGGTWTPASAPTTVWTPASSPGTNWTKH